MDSETVPTLAILPYPRLTIRRPGRSMDPPEAQSETESPDPISEEGSYDGTESPQHPHYGVYYAPGYSMRLVRSGLNCDSEGGAGEHLRYDEG